MTIATIQTKLARAKSDYKDALATLNQLRDIYKVSGSAYAAAKARQELLESKIANADTDIENANKLIQSQLEKNHFVKTEAVKSALVEKSEAETIKAELQRVHANGELPTQKLRIAASHDGKAVNDAFDRAHEAYARVQIWESLATGGRELDRSMALMSHVPRQPSKGESCNRCRAIARAATRLHLEGTQGNGRRAHGIHSTSAHSRNRHA